MWSLSVLYLLKFATFRKKFAVFLNASGGYLLIEVTDECEIVGAEIDNSKRSAIHSSIGEISPMCHYDYV